jgi:hypothetical protein
MEAGMQAGRSAWAIATVAILTLAGCSSDQSLMNVRSTTQGPDEFGVLPTKPLEMPENLAALPPPTPGGANITDPTPQADAIAALGGNPSAPRGGVPASDGALARYAGRYGVSPDIRGVLAAEDLAFREDNQGRVLEKLFNLNVYYKAYEPYSLDQYAELEKWRARGLRTPSAPPEP